jgi:5-methyltetrahydropteroyltriglutamate--homocysteine methyltransferase
MATKIVDKILPTTMVGSYPRPHWFKHQLLGRDVRVAFKEVQHEEAYTDAVATVIRDQEEAGLDIVTDGNMWYDDYVGVIGSFCWYMYERIGGFEPSREPHPAYLNADASQIHTIMDDWGGVINSGPVTHGPIRLVDLYKIASQHSKLPVKVSVGAGPANLAWHVHFKHYKTPKELAFALAPIFNKEMKDLVAAGAKYLQFEDLGPWM